MAGVISWVRRAVVQRLDPEREARVAAQAAEVWRRILAQRQAFVFDAACHSIRIEGQDRPAVAERVYRDAATKAWAQGVVDAAGRQTLTVVARVVGLSEEKRADADWDVCTDVFRATFAAAAAGGAALGPPERDKLAAVAASANRTVRDIVLNAFADEAADYLKKLFARAADGRTFGEAEWQVLVDAAAALGLTEGELRVSARPWATLLIERRLADARADGFVPDAAYARMATLAAAAALPPPARQYLDASVAAVNGPANVRAGHLPTVPVPGLRLKVGEVVHYTGQGGYARTAVGPNGAPTDPWPGTLYVTSYRMIFLPPGAPIVEVSHRRVTKLVPGPNYADVTAGSSKGAGRYYFVDRPDHGVLVYRTVVGRTSPASVVAVGASPARDIPAAVRTHAWQAAGGRCERCRALDLLEFVHTVPPAAGGTHDEANVRLLCARCKPKSTGEGQT